MDAHVRVHVQSHNIAVSFANCKLVKAHEDNQLMKIIGKSDNLMGAILSSLFASVCIGSWVVGGCIEAEKVGTTVMVGRFMTLRFSKN